MNLKNFKLSKLHYFILYLFLTFWLFARSGLNSDIGAFKYTHYLFNYEYEFIKNAYFEKWTYEINDGNVVDFMGGNNSYIVSIQDTVIIVKIINSISL